VLRQGRVRAIPAEATHIGICVDGAWAIETKRTAARECADNPGGPGRSGPAADEFENMFACLIAAARRPVCRRSYARSFRRRYTEPSQQRVAATALAIFNDRVLRRAIAARLSIVELRLVCDEESDYASETLLSHTGVRKVANVARSALYEISRNPNARGVFLADGTGLTCDVHPLDTFPG